MLAVHRCCFSSLPLPLTLSHARAQALHNAGLVHRDVKPLNLILSEGERRFKLIDLGAAADLRNGTNYVPGARALCYYTFPNINCVAAIIHIAVLPS